MSITDIKISYKWVICIAVLLFTWFTLFLGNRPFATPDEGRYVEIPREMTVTHDYVTPRLNGVKYFEKPPLFYWLQAASIKAFGLGEAPMRLWVTLLATLGCLAVFLFGAYHFTPPIGLAAAFILATAPLYYAIGRLIVLDMPVTVFITCSMFAFLQTIHTPPGRTRRLWAYAFYAACALGVLTKGIMTLAVAGCVIVIWATITRSWRDLWPAYLPTGLLLFFSISAPWHILASIRNPEFLHKYFIVEHFLRYTTSYHDRSAPFYFFIPVVLIGFFPWICLFITRSKNSDHKKITSFLWTWIAFVFIFFSAGNSKLIPYVLPLFPPLALLAALKWQTCNAKHVTLLHGISSIVIAMIGLALLKFVPDLISGKESLLPYVYTLIGIFFAGGILSLILRTRLWALPVHAISLIIAMIFASPEFQKPSLKPLAQHILSIKKPGDRIVCFISYSQDLPVYLQQTITTVGISGELGFGTTVEDTTSWMMDIPQLPALWHSGERLLFIVRHRDLNFLHDFGLKYTELADINGHYLLTNKVTPPAGNP